MKTLDLTTMPKDGRAYDYLGMLYDLDRLLRDRDIKRVYDDDGKRVFSTYSIKTALLNCIEVRAFLSDLATSCVGKDCDGYMHIYCIDNLHSKIRRVRFILID